MNTQIDETRRKGREIRRWLNAVAMAAALATLASGCSLDAASLDKNVAGAADLSDVQEIHLTDVDPQVDVSVPKEADETGGLLGSGREDEGANKSRIHITIGGNEDLTLNGKRIVARGNNPTCHSPAGDDLGLPTVITSFKSGELQESCIEAGGDPEIELSYKIAGTNDLFWMWSKVPLIGNNELKCSVINAKTWKTNVNSDYYCSFEWLQDGGHGHNPMPKVKINKKPTETVTSASKAQELLKANCSANQPHCKYESAKQTVEVTPESQWTIISGPHNQCNTPTKPELHKWHSEKAFGWENTFGGKIGLDLGLIPEVVELSIQTTYEHTWTEKYVYGEELEAEVEYGWAHIFYAQPAYLHIQGDFYITTKEKIYKIPDADFKLLLSKPYKVEGGQTISPIETHSRRYKINCPGDGSKLENTKIPNIKNMVDADAEMKVS